MADRPRLRIRYRVTEGLLDAIEERCDLVFCDGPVLACDDAELARTWGIWTFGETIDDALLDRMPALRCVLNFGVGVDGIDRDALARRGIAFGWPVGANAEAVADHAMALLLGVARGIRPAVEAFGDRRWDRWSLRTLAGSRALVLGWGETGRAIGRRLRGFEVLVQGVRRQIGRAHV